MTSRFLAAVAAITLSGLAAETQASDHLDTRTVIEDPSLDIGDLYAWTSGGRVNLVMTIVGHSFSPKARYVFHIASGSRLGDVRDTVTISCRFPSQAAATCEAPGIDRVQGDPRSTAGLESHDGHIRLFAGLRDDPFYNNVRGSRDAYQVAARTMKAGAPIDAAGCPQLGTAASSDLLSAWRHTDGGPARNFLLGWTPASLVVSVETRKVARYGPMLAVWGATVVGGRQTDRMGRPLTGNALLKPLAHDEVSDALKEKYNAAAPKDWAQFEPAIAETLGLYDSFDGICGNAFLTENNGPPKSRYAHLAKLLADDRLWLKTSAPVCRQFFAVELAALGGQPALSDDCGGRTPTEDAVDVYRSLLATGKLDGITDGVDRDEKDHSQTDFPFLAAP
ncbi:MAG TPA: DUF4331 family protein [Sphingomicrobium sp.]